MEKRGQIVVLGRERQPGDVEVQCQHGLPQSQHRAGFGTPGRTLNHHTALAARFEQPRHQRFARHELARTTRWNQPRARHGL